MPSEANTCVEVIVIKNFFAVNPFYKLVSPHCY